MGKKVSLEPQSLSCGKWQFAYPIYSVSSAFIKDLDAHIVLVAGGGGKSKTGVPNAFNLLKLDTAKLSTEEPVSPLLHQTTEDRIVYATDIHPTLPIFAVAEEQHCYLYRFITKDQKLEGIEVLQNFQSDFKTDSVQNICKFSPDGKILATAGEEGIIRLWEIDSKLKKDNIVKKILEIEFQESINDLAFSMDSKMIVYTSKTDCHIYEIENRKKITDIKVSTTKKGPRSFKGCTFIQESGNIITPQGKPRFHTIITKWNTATGSLVKNYNPSLEGPPSALGSSVCDKKQIIGIAFGEGDIEAFSVSEKGNVSRHFKKKNVHSFITTSITVTDDHKYILSGSADRTFAATKLIGGSSGVISIICLVFLSPILLVLFLFIWITGLQDALGLLASF